MTNIGSSAFIGNVMLYDVYNLSNLTITKGSTNNGYVGYYAMAIHTSLSEPAAVTKQGDFLFATINERNTLVGYKGNSAEVTLPNLYNGAHYDIGNNAFYKKNLTGFVMSMGVDSIYSNAFNGSSFSKVDVKDLTWWCSAVNRFASNPLSKASHLYLNGEEIRDLVIPSSVSSIGKSAFSGCNYLTSITIPSSVKKIGSNAFNQNSNLKRINVSDLNSWLDVKLESAASHPFYPNRNGDLYVNGKIVTDLVLPDAITIVPNYAFFGCNIHSVVLPNTLISIGNSAFGNCENLWEVYNLSRMDIKKGETANGYVAYNAKAVYNSLDPERVIQEVNGFVFNTATEIPELFMYNGTQKDIVLPDSYNGKDYVIADKTFYMNKNISSIIVPDGVKGIGKSAFCGCTNLNEVKLPKNITKIDDDTFGGCSHLTEISIPEGVTSIGEGSFSQCDNLRNVQLPSTLTTIGFNAFYECYGIKSIVLPASVTSIDDMAFYSTYIHEVYNLSKIDLKKGNSANGGYVTFYAEAIHTSLDEPSIVMKQDGFMFIYKGSSIKMIGYDGDTKSTILPDELNGKSYDLYSYAFCGSPDITSITCNKTTPPSQHTDVFYNVSKDIPVFVPDESIERYKNSSNWKEFKNIGGISTKTTSISLASPNIELVTGESYPLEVTTNPTNALMQKFEWFSSDESIVTVDEDGIITATAIDNSDAKSECRITVIKHSEPDTDTSKYSNIIYAEKTEAQSGTQITLPIDLKNVDSFVGFQFDLYLPDGITVEKDEYEDPVFERTGRISTKITLEASGQTDGSTRFLCYSAKNYTLTGTEGEILNVALNIPEDMEEGDYPVYLKNVIMNKEGNEKVQIDEVISTLSISAYTPGDADNDGSVDVVDIGCVASHILGNTSTTFNSKAADYDQDGSIDVVDIGGIASYILGGAAKVKSEWLGSRMDETSATMSIAPLSIAAGESKWLDIVLQNTDYEVCGSQFDITLPQGLSFVTDAEGNPILKGQRSNAHCTEGALKDGILKVLSYSAQNDCYSGKEGAIVSVLVKADKDYSEGNGYIELRDILLARISGQGVSKVSLNNLHTLPTSLASIEETRESNVYNLYGWKLTTPQKGVNIINGKKTFIK